MGVMCMYVLCTRVKGSSTSLPTMEGQMMREEVTCMEPASPHTCLPSGLSLQGVPNPYPDVKQGNGPSTLPRIPGSYFLSPGLDAL